MGGKITLIFDPEYEGQDMDFSYYNLIALPHSIAISHKNDEHTCNPEKHHIFLYSSTVLPTRELLWITLLRNTI